MYKHLKEQTYYENLYDKLTIEEGKKNEQSFQKIYDDFFIKSPQEDPKRNGVIMSMNIIYMAIVGSRLLDRYDKRDEAIQKWINSDSDKDERISQARLSEEPKCQHCGNYGLRIIDKDLMSRGKEHSTRKDEEILFMLHCKSCDKNSAYWQNGDEWERRQELCPKCSTALDRKTTRYSKFITTTYSCKNCGQSHKDKMDISTKNKPKEIDPDFVKDREYFCLQDEKIREELRDARYRFEEMARLGKDMEERSQNKHIYDAIKEIKKPKIAQLTEILVPRLEKAGFIEFRLDKPEIGKEVVIGFSCLDSLSERSDYDSERTLKKTIIKSLEDTNWRLMSDGIRYRLGYLSGRLKAYESENSIKELVEKRSKRKA